MLTVHVLIGALLMWGRYQEADLLRGLQAGRAVADNQLEASDTFIDFIASLYVPAYVVTLVAFLVWVYKSNERARSAGAEGMRFSPRASVLWFFLPLANVVQPVRIVNEIWKAASLPTASDPSSWQRRPGSWLVALWWVAFLGLSVAGRGLPRTLPETPTIDGLIQVSQAAFVVSALIAASALLGLAVVLGIEQRLRVVEHARFERPAGLSE